MSCRRRLARLAATGLTLLAVPCASAAAAAPSTIAVIGDTPYGAAQIAQFPNDVAAINADPATSLTIHLGDIKNGGSQCTDPYFATIRSDLDAFEDPLVYTPGDNEWTDCHRANNGGYLPTERLAKLRAPGVLIGIQADMFDPLAAHLDAYKPYIARLTKLASAFGKPVLLLNGDSHIFEADHPLPGAPNLSRVTVNGSDTCPHEYLRLDIDPSAPAVFSFARVALPSSALLCAT